MGEGPGGPSGWLPEIEDRDFIVDAVLTLSTPDEKTLVVQNRL